MNKPKLSQEALDAIQAADALLQQAVEAKRAGRWVEPEPTMLDVMATLKPFWESMDELKDPKKVEEYARKYQVEKLLGELGGFLSKPSDSGDSGTDGS